MLFGLGMGVAIPALTVLVATPRRRDFAVHGEAPQAGIEDEDGG